MEQQGVEQEPFFLNCEAFLTLTPPTQAHFKTSVCCTSDPESTLNGLDGYEKPEW